MSRQPDDHRYEFSEGEDAVFFSLASAMQFVAIAMLVTCAAAATAAGLVVRTNLAASAILGPLALAVAIMAVQLYRAAGHFRRIVTTQGQDIDNLLVAAAELTVAYRLQRWLWLLLAAIVVIALATTIVGG